MSKPDDETVANDPKAAVQKDTPKVSPSRAKPFLKIAWRRVFVSDSLLLGATFSGGIYLSLHGKALAETLLRVEDVHLVRPSDHTALVYIPIFLALGIMLFFRHIEMSTRRVALYGSMCGAVGAIFSSALSEDPESSVLFLKVFMFGALLVVIYLERFLDGDYGVEFWKTITDSVAKGVRYIIALFIGGFAVLKYVSDSIGESKDGFMTTLVYPCFVMLISFFMWGIWLFLPAWEKLVESYKSDHARSAGLAPDSGSPADGEG